MSFLAEIKRRKVFQVAAVYAVVAWLIIQIVGEVSEPLSLPDWLDTVVIVLLAVGFPIAVILAWAFDVTPEGVVRDKGTPVGATSGRRIEYVLIGLVVIALGWLVYRVEFDSGGVGGVQREGVLPNSVAVLPFQNLSPDPDNAYFAAGIHEETLNQLASIRDLSVISRTSVLQYADERPPIPEIATALNVQAVMEGSVRFADGRVRIQAQLIDGSTDEHLWADVFERDLVDVFIIQAEIAEHIAIALEAELLPSERQRIQKVLTSSPEALALYLKATNIGAGPDGVGPTELFHRLLDRAIEFDPDFARAHAYKARDYAFAMVRSRSSNGPTVSELEELAFKHARLALSIDSEESSAYAAMGRIHRYSWRGSAAQAAYEKALELAPNDPVSLASFATLLRDLGEYDRAIEFARRTNELDPHNGVLARMYLVLGNFDAAYTTWNDRVSIHPDPYSYAHLAVVEWHRGNQEAAIRNIQSAERLLLNIDPGALSRIIMAYGQFGRHDDALRLFHKLEQIADTYHVSASVWALANLGTGEYEQVLTLLKTIDEDRSPEDTFIANTFVNNRYHHPALERPEFVDIRNKLRLKR